MLNLVQGIVDKELKGLEQLLESVDKADFNVSNKEDGTSIFDKCINVVTQVKYNTEEAINYIMNCFKKYNARYYCGFKYEIYKVNEDKYVVTISTYK